MQPQHRAAVSKLSGPSPEHVFLHHALNWPARSVKTLGLARAYGKQHLCVLFLRLKCRAVFQRVAPADSKTSREIIELGTHRGCLCFVTTLRCCAVPLRPR
ncbi:hypothetical protein MRX96_040183 [Rhipicephalus microplus]